VGEVAYLTRCRDKVYLSGIEALCAHRHRRPSHVPPAIPVGPPPTQVRHMARQRERSPLSSPAWQRFRARLIATAPHPVCHLCGQWVDVTLSGMDPMGPTVDHLVPVSRGGAVFDPANCAVTHRRCNTARGNNDLEEPEPSRDW